MKKDLKKELLKYSSAAAAILGINEAGAQYQYTNIADTTIDYNNGFYNLDLDQDGQMDFQIKQYVDTGAAGNTNAVLIQPYTNTINRIAGEKIAQYNYPFNLQAATIVDNATGWDGAGGQFTTGYMAFVVDGQAYPNSNWVGPLTNGFLGLQLWKSDGIRYGWARLDISEDSKSFRVKDFSVNLTPDSSIVVGYELLGEIENLLDGVRIQNNGEILTLTKPSSVKNITVRLIGLSGQILKSVEFNSESTDILVAHLPSALYILELESEGLLRREKLLF